jgi:hypothetical protein
LIDWLIDWLIVVWSVKFKSVDKVFGSDILISLPCSLCDLKL